MTNIRIKKLFVIGNYFFYLTNKKNSTAWVCNNFSRQFHFFWVPSMKNIILDIFKNPTVKFSKIWCNDVDRYIIYSAIV